MGNPIPKYACSACGQFSARRDTLERHILNPRIHGGQGEAVPIARYIAGTLTNRYIPKVIDTTKETKDLRDIMEEAYYKELGVQAAKRQAGMTYRSTSAPNLIPSSPPIQNNTHNKLAFGLVALPCSGCSGIYPVLIMFGDEPGTSTKILGHNCVGQQFGVVLDEMARNANEKATKGAIRSLLCQLTMMGMNKNPHMIALKLPKNLDGSITVVRKNDDLTQFVSMPKSSLARALIAPSDSDLGILFMTAITNGGIGLSEENVKTIIGYFKDNTFGLLETNGYGEYLCAIVPGQVSAELSIQPTEQKSSNPESHGIKMPFGMPHPDIGRKAPAYTPGQYSPYAPQPDIGREAPAYTYTPKLQSPYAPQPDIGREAPAKKPETGYEYRMPQPNIDPPPSRFKNRPIEKPE